MEDVANASQGPSRRLLLPLLVVSIALGTMGTTIIVPSLPYLAESFSVDYGAVTLLQTAYLLGLAFPQLAYGGVSDRFGRRPVMLFGLVLFVLGSAVCAMATGMGMLIAGRLVQAIGGCAGITLARAILRDLFSREQAASRLAYVMMVMVLAPMLAPLIGGHLHVHLGWQAIFVLMAALGAITLAVFVVRLPETNPPNPVRQSWSDMARGFGHVLGSKTFAAHAVPTALCTATFQSFLVGSAYMLERREAGTPGDFGFYYLVPATGYFIGNFLSGRFVGRIGSDRLILAGNAISVLGCAAMLLTSTVDPLTPFGLFGSMFVVSVGHGMVIANGVVAATSAVPGRFGTAAGMAGFLQLFLAGVLGFVVGVAIEKAEWLFVPIMFVASVAALTVFVAAHPLRRASASPKAAESG